MYLAGLAVQGVHDLREVPPFRAVHHFQVGRVGLEVLELRSGLVRRSGIHHFGKVLVEGRLHQRQGLQDCQERRPKEQYGLNKGRLWPHIWL